MGCVRVCPGVHGYAQVHAGVRWCAWVCAKGCAGCTVQADVCQWAQVCVEVSGCLRVCVWDEFSGYLLENRVPTSADFNTYPIRIFIIAMFGFTLVHQLNPN